MKEQIIEHVKNLKEQGANNKVDEDQINDLISKIFDKKYEKYEKYKKDTYADVEIDVFLVKYEYENISISYDKNKPDTEKISKSLIKLRNKVINFSEFIEEYNKFMNNFKRFEDYKAKKEPGSISPNQKKNDKICKRFKRYC